jgi:hypothetical protein
VLDVSLPYESHPSTHKRVGFTDGEDAGVLLIAHWARNGAEHKVTLSSGFALDAPGVGTNECMVLTCAHTLEEARTGYLLEQCLRLICACHPDSLVWSTAV